MRTQPLFEKRRSEVPGLLAWKTCYYRLDNSIRAIHRVHDLSSINGDRATARVNEIAYWLG